MNGFPWVAIGSLAGCAVFVAVAIWQWGRAEDRRERDENRPHRERTRLTRRERRQFQRLARRNRDLNHIPDDISNGKEQNSW